MEDYGKLSVLTSYSISAVSLSMTGDGVVAPVIARQRLFLWKSRSWVIRRLEDGQGLQGSVGYASERSWGCRKSSLMTGVSASAMWRPGHTRCRGSIEPVTVVVRHHSGAQRRIGNGLFLRVRSTKLDLLWRMPGILYSRSRSSRS